MAYDRYGKFRVNGDTLFPPFIPIPVKDTDYYEVYEKGKTRLDILSYNYYKVPHKETVFLKAGLRTKCLVFFL